MTITRTVDSIYNPNQLTRDELIDRFVVRTKKFEQLYRHIHEAKMDVPEEHLLIIGQRGMGKTTLLLRLAYEVERDEKLKDWLIPVVFKEEQYGIRKLFNLWEETAHLLADKDVHFEGLFDEMDALYTNNQEEEHYEKIIFNLLIEKLQTQRKKIILFIDNLQDLLKKLTKQESQRLRKILITCPDVRIITASPVSIDALHDYKHPLFEHFKTFHLKGLNEEETVALIRKLGESYKPDEVDDLIKNQRARIETIRRITGGVIRTNVLLFEIFVDDRKGDVFRDLERLLDRVTPLYKDRTDDLPKNQQVIIDAIALDWDATTTKAIKQRTRLESKVISAQLAQLAKNDWIEIIPTNTKNHLYRLKERFYNIWYLMRNGRKQDAQRVLWLVQFLEDWLDENGTKTRIERMIKCFESGEYDEKGAFYMTEALIRTSHVTYANREDLLCSAKAFLEKRNSDLAKHLTKSDVELMELSVEFQEKGQKLEAFNTLLKLKYMPNFVYALLGEYSREFKNYNDAREYYKKAIELGYDDVANDLGSLLYEMEDYERAENYYLMGVANGDVIAMHNLASLYQNKKQDYVNAEKYYKKAIELDHNDSMNDLGTLFYEMNNYKRAEEYYLKASKIGNATAMYNLGFLYHSKKQDYTNAEKYYHKAIEHGDENAIFALGNLYFERGNYEEAKRYYLKAVEQNHFLAASNLSIIYFQEQNYKEEMKMLKKALSYSGFTDSIQFSETIICLLACGEKDFVYSYFNSDFAKKYQLKERYKPLWFVADHYKKNTRALELIDIIKLDNELKETFHEIMSNIIKVKNIYAKNKKIPHQTTEDSDK